MNQIAVLPESIDTPYKTHFRRLSPPYIAINITWDYYIIQRIAIWV
jgi:hypothetical protein